MIQSGETAYRTGLVVALVASFLTVWTTIVRDDGAGMSHFLLIMAAAVGGFSASFRPAGMARTMLGVAIMQALLGAATATAPSAASVSDGAFKALLFGGFLAVLWLISATCFRAASKRGHKPVAAHQARKPDAGC